MKTAPRAASARAALEALRSVNDTTDVELQGMIDRALGRRRVRL